MPDIVEAFDELLSVAADWPEFNTVVLGVQLIQDARDELVELRRWRDDAIDYRRWIKEASESGMLTSTCAAHHREGGICPGCDELPNGWLGWCIRCGAVLEAHEIEITEDVCTDCELDMRDDDIRAMEQA